MNGTIGCCAQPENRGALELSRVLEDFEEMFGWKIRDGAEEAQYASKT